MNSGASLKANRSAGGNKSELKKKGYAHGRILRKGPQEVSIKEQK